MKHLLLLLFTLPLFAAAQTTVDENKIAKLELVYSIHESPLQYYVVVKVTNKTNQPFTVWLNDGEANTEMHEVAAKEVKEIWLYGFTYGQTSAGFARKNGKFINAEQLYVDVPEMYY